MAALAAPGGRLPAAGSVTLDPAATGRDLCCPRHLRDDPCQSVASVFFRYGSTQPSEAEAKTKVRPATRETLTRGLIHGFDGWPRMSDQQPPNDYR